MKEIRELYCCDLDGGKCDGKDSPHELYGRDKSEDDWYWKCLKCGNIMRTNGKWGGTIW